MDNQSMDTCLHSSTPPRRSGKDKPGSGDDDDSSGHGRITTRGTLHDASAPQRRRDDSATARQRPAQNSA